MLISCYPCYYVYCNIPHPGHPAVTMNFPQLFVLTDRSASKNLKLNGWDKKKIGKKKGKMC